MSTRANIIIKDDYDKLIFYRHSDGYPEGVKPTLDKLCTLVQEGELRDNVIQTAGWLITFGAQEMNECYKGEIPSYSKWKVGFYEPTTCVHDDIEHAYVVDLSDKTYKEIPIREAKKIWKAKK